MIFRTVLVLFIVGILTTAIIVDYKPKSIEQENRIRQEREERVGYKIKTDYNLNQDWQVLEIDGCEYIHLGHGLALKGNGNCGPAQLIRQNQTVKKDVAL